MMHPAIMLRNLQTVENPHTIHHISKILKVIIGVFQILSAECLLYASWIVSKLTQNGLRFDV
jgi:hypothetical protein